MSNLFGQTEPSFEYRESYFPQISYEKNFIENYQTNTLDLDWGLWGHNLPKWVEGEKDYSEKIYALINNKRDIKQFCFSSEELKKIIEKNIIQKKEYYKNFMIAPNDNAIVCQCNLCKEQGNTLTSATPAVFNLLNNLSEKYPNNNFFTTGYISTNLPPHKVQNKNVGVFYSTINFQQGKLYNNLSSKNKLENNLQEWSNKISKLYVWEYGLNYDNYFDFYPNLLTFQENLKFLKENHIKGVFINGSESYSVLQDVKCAIYAKLLLDIDLDLKKTIDEEFKKRYPNTLASLISNFYYQINKNFYNSSQKMGIYSNTMSAQLKYLSPKYLDDFYSKLSSADAKNDTDINLLLLATTFLKLEYMRTLGYQDYGYCSITNHHIKIKAEVYNLLANLEELIEETQVNIYNEQGASLKTYIQNWKDEILDQQKDNYFINLDYEILSKLDENYKNPEILKDSNYGFLDYNNNWLINSIDDLKLRVNTKTLDKKRILKINFLNDPLHHIYLPEEIILSSKNYQKTIKIAKSSKKEKVTFSAPLNFDKLDSLTITIKRLNLKNKKSQMACDEIIIN